MFLSLSCPCSCFFAGPAGRLVWPPTTVQKSSEIEHGAGPKLFNSRTARYPSSEDALRQEADDKNGSQGVGPCFRSTHAPFENSPPKTSRSHVNLFKDTDASLSEPLAEARN